MPIVLLIVGFCLVYAYDCNSITKQYPLVKKCFLLGCLSIVFATCYLILKNVLLFQITVGSVLCLIGALVSLALLVYTLFFALPFGKTYVTTTTQVCDWGMYALCRHPGVLWFFAFYLCLYGLLPTGESFWFFLMANVLNLAYVILQDTLIFPRTFPGYRDYQGTTPFLLPTFSSMKRCVATWRGV